MGHYASPFLTGMNSFMDRYVQAMALREQKDWQNEKLKREDARFKHEVSMDQESLNIRKEEQAMRKPIYESQVSWQNEKFKREDARFEHEVSMDQESLNIRKEEQAMRKPMYESQVSWYNRRPGSSSVSFSSFGGGMSPYLQMGAVLDQMGYTAAQKEKIMPLIPSDIGSLEEGVAAVTASDPARSAIASSFPRKKWYSDYFVEGWNNYEKPDLIKSIGKYKNMVGYDNPNTTDAQRKGFRGTFENMIGQFRTDSELRDYFNVDDEINFNLQDTDVQKAWDPKGAAAPGPVFQNEPSSSQPVFKNEGELDDETAMRILEEAGGDKEKARQIAVSRGYKL